MGPVGLWLPWSEVVELAGRCGWSGQDCGVAANICCGLQAVELDPRDGDERPAGPAQYRRVRVLATHATDGVLDVSDSSDCEATNGVLDVSDSSDCEATNPDDGLAQVDIFGDDLDFDALATDYASWLSVVLPAASSSFPKPDTLNP